MSRTYIVAHDAPEIEAALPRVVGVRGHYRVYRDREQTDAEGRDWADYHGPSRSDETTPVYSGTSAAGAAAALLRTRDDSSMGGHRYARVVRGGVVVAVVSRRGNVIVGRNPRISWDTGKPAWTADGKIREAAS